MDIKKHHFLYSPRRIIMGRFEEIQKVLNEVSPVPVNLPKLYLLGDTGAGKTTIIRKILGTEENKFPTTRQTRTTVAPTEYVIREGNDYDITVILKPLSEIEGYIDEIIREAIARFQKDNDKNKITKNLRQTSDQRFRLYYLLPQEYIDRISQKIIDLSPLVEQKVEEYKNDFPEDKEETGIFVEFALNELGEDYKSICNDVIAEIQRKVESVCDGEKLGSSWKIYKYSDSNKDSFLAKSKEILSSESNSISPLIEYARVRGNLKAPWVSPNTEAVIIDGEGIGHNTKETGQLSSRHYDYFYIADAILLIEESKKPFVAGGKNALKSICERGYKDKLLVLFTKLDEVEPYDIDDPTNDDRREEVQDALTNVLASLKEDGVDIDLSENTIYYLGGMKEKGLGEDAIEQLNSVLAWSRKLSKFEGSFVRPNYDFEMLSAFLVESTKKFNDLYQQMLEKQHWKTIEAFSRRMYLGIDGFRMFTPIADFEEKINDEIKKFIAKPISWSQEVSNQLKEQSLDSIRREFNKLIIEYARTEIISLPHDNWDRAYMYTGIGSTFKRRNDIKAILQSSVPPFVASIDTKKFKDRIKSMLEKAIANCEKV